ncbi:hypothetical protein HZS_141 [Henneguya salminicola]|nr:hypothetical protein HZS_141 [Henneguya salminicola]
MLIKPCNYCKVTSNQSCVSCWLAAYLDFGTKNKFIKLFDNGNTSHYKLNPELNYITSMTYQENDEMNFYFVKNPQKNLNQNRIDRLLIDILFTYKKFTFINLVCNPCRSIYGYVDIIAKIKFFIPIILRTYFMNYDNIYRAMIIKLKVGGIQRNFFLSECKKNDSANPTTATSKNIESTSLSSLDKNKCSFQFAIKAKEKQTVLGSLLFDPKFEKMDTNLYLQIDMINDTFQQNIAASLEAIFEKKNHKQRDTIGSWKIQSNQHSYEYSTIRKGDGHNNKFNISFKLLYEYACKNNNPCKNNANCTGTVNNYKCICKKNTYGKHCEFFSCSPACKNSKCIGINQCSNPCNPGWSGKDCTDVSCDQYPCMNSGVCELDNNTRVCRCNNQRFTGEFCQFKCKNKCINGICDFKNGAIKCVCFSGFYGKLCEESYLLVSQFYAASISFIIILSLILFISTIFIAILICSYICAVIKLKKKAKKNIVNTLKYHKNLLSVNYPMKFIFVHQYFIILETPAMSQTQDNSTKRSSENKTEQKDDPNYVYSLDSIYPIYNLSTAIDDENDDLMSNIYQPRVSCDFSRGK